jgi:hypothetical protein
VLRNAAAHGNLAVLEWLRLQGAATPDDCRGDFNEALVDAAGGGHRAVLEWLDKQGAATPDDCRIHDNDVLHIADFHADVDFQADVRDPSAVARAVDVLEWLAGKLTLAEFESVGRQDVWRRVWLCPFRRTMLTLVLAGGRKKRLPPELLEMVEDFY